MCLRCGSSDRDCAFAMKAVALEWCDDTVAALQNRPAQAGRKLQNSVPYFVLAAFASAVTALFESCDEFMNFVTTSVIAPATASP